MVGMSGTDATRFGRTDIALGVDDFG